MVLVVSDPAKLWESAKLVSERDLGGREGRGEGGDTSGSAIRRRTPAC